LQVVIAIISLIYQTLYELYYELLIRARLEPLLRRYSSYYSRLTDNRSEFKRSVWEFIRQNEFIPREDLKIKLPLKVIIASHAVQLSFRLSDNAYDYYDKIIVYKDYYLSRLTNRFHKAEVNPGLKVIVFSVKGIFESLKREDDGLNVLLHEFAHALWLEQLLMHREYEVFDKQHFEDIRLMIGSEINKHANDETHFFRKYAFANEAEFFAVAVENFFERSEQFRNRMPELYESLVDLFNQDPLP
jgi:MtfA peptidase